MSGQKGGRGGNESRSAGPLKHWEKFGKVGLGVFIKSLQNRSRGKKEKKRKKMRDEQGE